MAAEQNPSSTDPGLTVLVALLRFQGIGADPEQVRHRMGMATIGVPEMLRYAKELGLKAKVRSSNWERLATTPQPSIAVCAMAVTCCSARPATTRRSCNRRTSRAPNS